MSTISDGTSKLWIQRVTRGGLQFSGYPTDYAAIVALVMECVSRDGMIAFGTIRKLLASYEADVRKQDAEDSAPDSLDSYTKLSGYVARAAQIDAELSAAGYSPSLAGVREAIAAAKQAKDGAS